MKIVLSIQIYPACAKLRKKLLHVFSVHAYVSRFSKIKLEKRGEKANCNFSAKSQNEFAYPYMSQEGEDVMF